MLLQNVIGTLYNGYMRTCYRITLTKRSWNHMESMQVICHKRVIKSRVYYTCILAKGYHVVGDTPRKFLQNVFKFGIMYTLKRSRKVFREHWGNFVIHGGHCDTNQLENVLALFCCWHLYRSLSNLYIGLSISEHILH